MISYEDLVYALTEWRARKGLPTTSNTVVAAPIVAPVEVAAMRGGPPMAPPGRAAAPAPAAAAWTPEPAPQRPELIYQDDAISVDGEYAEAEVDASDAMSFDSVRPSTQPGFAPVPGGPPGGQRR